MEALASAVHPLDGVDLGVVREDARGIDVVDAVLLVSVLHRVAVELAVHHYEVNVDQLGPVRLEFPDNLVLHHSSHR